MRFLHAVAAAMLLLPSVPAAAEGPMLDAEAIELARASAEFLASRPAMSFNWFVSYDEVRDGREKLTYMRSGTGS